MIGGKQASITPVSRRLMSTMKPRWVSERFGYPAVFVAAGLGLKLGWTVIDPGGRTRSSALAQEGRALVVGALGLAVMLLVSGFIEGFVTPSGLPTWMRIGIGLVAEGLFLTWVFVFGRRAARAGVTGDLRDDLRGNEAPTS